MLERSDRRHPTTIDRSDARTSFAQDRDCLLHSAAFRRLGQVTQVMAPDGKNLFHNRLSHSLEVARIGRALAELLLRAPNGQAMAAEVCGLDPVVVEAAALAHDLGHPPFGHDAEDELDQLLTNAGVADGFEANAQSFRVVCKLAEPDATLDGMNLTRATLAAILKYPWQRHESPANPTKWGAYESESEELTWARALMSTGSQEPTLEAQLMDWADLVAYAALDCEDFVRTGLIPMEQLHADPAERERFLGLVCARRDIPAAEQGELSAAFERLLAVCPVPRLSPDTRAGRAALRCFTNHEVNDAVRAVSLSKVKDWPRLQIDPASHASILLLEGLTWHYVIDSGLLATQRHQQRQVIRLLFERFASAAIGARDDDLFSPAIREHLRAASGDAARLRVVSDLIASMTEDQAMEEYHHNSALASADLDLNEPQFREHCGDGRGEMEPNGLS